MRSRRVTSIKKACGLRRDDRADILAKTIEALPRMKGTSWDLVGWQLRFHDRYVEQHVKDQTDFQSALTGAVSGIARGWDALRPPLFADVNHGFGVQ